MLFRIVDKKQFHRLLELINEETEIVAPQQIDVDNGNHPVYQYLPVEKLDRITLDYDTTSYSAKTYFLPFKETLSEYHFEEDDWRQEIRYRIQPRVILGLHACDVNALVKLDKVFAKDFFPNPYYLSRRKNTFVIGHSCRPCEGAFCKAMGSETVTHGFDLFLTDLGDRYFVKIDSDRAYNLLKRIETREIKDTDTRDYLDSRNRFDCAYQEKLATHNLPNLLDIEFESPVWKKWGDKCLSCGSCAMTCPTCYCYGVTERVSMNNREGAKVKHLYSCNLVDFAMVAGNHNFRPRAETRLKYRYYHQHRGFVESFGQPMCVGCYRCGRVCLAGINPPDVIHDLQTEHE
ncbi:MAG: 4Fe-4S dicluster domain-containing protein [Planctomycetes bacterium]|nr:4Fe-4S dicluster domain-containing protein [Planctomycetota bacterium]